jgi:exosortase family protein XrtG
MTWPHLQLIAGIYLAGLLWTRQRQWRLLQYVWGAFGFAFLGIHLSLIQGWDVWLSALEVRHVQSLMAPLSIHLQYVDKTTLLIPDSTGWSGLRVGVECSTLIELSVLAGLVLFYPRLALNQRWSYLTIGLLGTYLLNLLRIIVIVMLIWIWGKPIVPFAHAIFGRLLYFVGVVALYWFLLTRPTLKLVHRSIEVSGRAVR